MNALMLETVLLELCWEKSYYYYYYYYYYS